VSAVLALLSLSATLLTIRRSRLSSELQTFERVFGELRKTASKIYEVRSASAKAPDPIAEARESASDWRDDFLNALEYFSFLINNKYCSDRRFIRFVGHSAVRWHDDIYLEYVTDKERANPEFCEELRCLHKRLTKL
jgi:hypothetical protein